MNKYLVWSQKIPDYKSQRDACWIGEHDKDIPYMSLLPIRFYDRREFYGGRYLPFHASRSFYLLRDGFYGSWLKGRFDYADHYFAEKLYYESAEQLFKEFPNIEDIHFGEQDEYGIYPVFWAVPYTKLIDRLTEIIKEKLQNGFSVDECMSVEYNEDGTAEIKGVFDKSESELERIFEEHKDDLNSIELKKGLKFSFEDCMYYYAQLDEELLAMGNQFRASLKT